MTPHEKNKTPLFFASFYFSIKRLQWFELPPSPRLCFCLLCRASVLWLLPSCISSSWRPSAGCWLRHGSPTWPLLAKWGHDSSASVSCASAGVRASTVLHINTHIISSFILFWGMVLCVFCEIFGLTLTHCSRDVLTALSVLSHVKNVLISVYTNICTTALCWMDE